MGTKVDHHTNGVIIADKLLLKYGYQKDKMRKVIGCVINHWSSKNATSNEELCAADADIIAHYDNIPMCFEVLLNTTKSLTLMIKMNGLNILREIIMI